METNQNLVQENSAQRIALALEQPAEPLYDPAEAARIVHCLTDGYFDPEYILLFGKLVGGTPHSDAMAYDLLMVVRETPEYDWMQTKRILRYKVPYSCRKITYINLYIMTLSYVESNSTPFLFFAHAEGELLYCSDSYHFQRPKHPIDFAKAYADAKFHFDTFRTQGNELLEQAQDAFSESRNMRLAAQFSAQAMVYFYHTLYYVYHGLEFDSHDPVIMHDRMRTLSTKLMLAFDDTHIENIFTLPRLKSFLQKSPYCIRFDIAPQKLDIHMERVRKASGIIENLCGLRLELYKELSERQKAVNLPDEKGLARTLTIPQAPVLSSYFFGAFVFCDFSFSAFVRSWFTIAAPRSLISFSYCLTSLFTTSIFLSSPCSNTRSRSVMSCISPCQTACIYRYFQSFLRYCRLFTACQIFPTTDSPAVRASHTHARTNRLLMS